MFINYHLESSQCDCKWAVNHRHTRVCMGIAYNIMLYCRILLVNILCITSACPLCIQISYGGADSSLQDYHIYHQSLPTEAAVNNVRLNILENFFWPKFGIISIERYPYVEVRHCLVMLWHSYRFACKQFSFSIKSNIPFCMTKCTHMCIP